MKRRLMLACGFVLLAVLQAVVPASAHEGQIGAIVSGAGQLDVAGTPVAFAYLAVRDEDGRARGQFVQRQPDTLTVGQVTCLTNDPVNHRAWVGGVIVYSNDPTPDHQVGDAVWFRAVDYAQGGPDRSTVFGFKGAAGFDTSAAYCAGMPWAAGDARTWLVTLGDLTVRP